MPASLLLAMAAVAVDPVYHIRLDERQPQTVAIELRVGRHDAPLTLVRRPGAAGTIDPSCDQGRIQAAVAGRWILPPECSTVRWNVAITDQDTSGVDAAYPVSVWSSGGHWWLLTEHMPWFMAAGSAAGARIRIEARFGDHDRMVIAGRLPGAHRPPWYRIVARRPALTMRRHGFGQRLFGELPTELSRADALAVTEMWAGWRRDAMPANTHAPSRLDIVWLRPPPGSPPGFMASAGADTLVMQNIEAAQPTRADKARLRGALLMAGAHEGFHAISGAIDRTWPAWVNESLASFFAYRESRAHLDAEALAELDALIQAPANAGLLAVQTAYDKGDQGETSTIFYGKGARFWSRIEAILTGRDSPSGRLAALIRDSDGFAGVDWRDPASMTRFLDAHSGGKAGAIVRCYLVEAGCG